MITIEKNPSSKTAWYDGVYEPKTDSFLKEGYPFSIGITHTKNHPPVSEIQWEKDIPNDWEDAEELIKTELDNMFKIEQDGRTKETNR